MSTAAEQAGEILGNRASLPAGEDLRELVEGLKGSFDYRLGRKILARAREREPGDVWVVQQLALCTYKDEDRHPQTRFGEALELLETIGLRDTASVAAENRDSLAETLALGGAVYKRKWEFGGQLEDLHQALGFYRAAWARDKDRDTGYAGVNAAYVLDVLASRARVVAARGGTEPVEAERWREQADELRGEMRKRLVAAQQADSTLQGDYWFAATLAEVHFGLGEYDEAADWLARARAAGPGEWALQTTAKQLISIARLQRVEAPVEGSPIDQWHDAWRALRGLLQEDTEPALSCYRGKIGLALSGGGFRASLFHLGVLTRLAEMDVLRHVEVLSTVSGGSIVGAHYYLEVKQLLESRDDKDIGAADYVEIVERVRRRFVAGVQCNIRTRALSSLGANLKMVFTREYTRSHRLGELYDEHLYRNIGAPEPATDAARNPAPVRTMEDLKVAPLEGGAPNTGFKPRFSNWRRRARIPVILLNTTSLNSGHAWQFTASWMGEPPGLLGSQIDLNRRYRRLWNRQAPRREHREYPMSYAVAASSCVPGLFEPLVLEGLYPERTVRLVDGGVHDNQGVAGLLNEGCTLVLCSDASGQMADEENPSNSVIGVPLRSNGILMDRVREAQYQDLQARVDSHSLNGLFFIHMQQDLDTHPLDWTGCDDPTADPAPTGNTTSYGMDRDIQRRLAAMRTDLDSFSEVEAHALMLSGYLMTRRQFEELDRLHRLDQETGSWGGFDIDAQPAQAPDFMRLESVASKKAGSGDAQRDDLGLQLEASSALFFKIWKLDKRLGGWLTAGGIALALLLLYGVYHFRDAELAAPAVTVGGLALFLLLAALTLFFPVARWLNPQKAMQGYLGKLSVAIVGWALTNLHLHLFDPMFLRRGRVERLLKLQQGERGANDGQ